MEEFDKFKKDFYRDSIAPEDYWPRWRSVWDNSHQFTAYFDGDLEICNEVLGNFFSQHLKFRSFFMTTSENNKLNSLQNQVDIFRGGQQANIAGWSWTLDRDHAEHFARSGATDDRPLITIARNLPSSAILAYLEKDGFSELIVDPLTVTIETASFGGIEFERLY